MVTYALSKARKDAKEITCLHVSAWDLYEEKLGGGKQRAILRKKAQRARTRGWMDAECGVGDIGGMQRTSADADVR
jgi:hypothetical protein